MKERKTVKYTHWKCFIYHIVHRMEMNRPLKKINWNLKFKFSSILFSENAMVRNWMGIQFRKKKFWVQSGYRRYLKAEDFFAFAKRRNEKEWKEKGYLFEVKTFSFHQKRFKRFFFFILVVHILFRFVWSKWSLWIFRIKHNIYAKDSIA